MRVPRIYTEQPLRAGREVLLPEQAGEHVARVLRLERGHPLILFNGDGCEYDATLASLAKRSVTAEIIAIRDIDPGTASARESTRCTRMSKFSSESPVRATMVLRLSGLLSRVTVFSVWSLNANRSMRPLASHSPIVSSASRL